MVRRNVFVNKSTWEALKNKSTVFKVSDIVRILLEACNEGLIDVHVLAQKLNEKKSK